MDTSQLNQPKVWGYKYSMETVQKEVKFEYYFLYVLTSKVSDKGNFCLTKYAIRINTNNTIIWPEKRIEFQKSTTTCYRLEDAESLIELGMNAYKVDKDGSSLKEIHITEFFLAYILAIPFASEWTSDIKSVIDNLQINFEISDIFGKKEVPTDDK